MMMKKSLAAALALLLCLCLLMGTVAMAEVVTAPVDAPVDEAQDQSLWTPEIAESALANVQPTGVTLNKTGKWRVPLGKKKSYQLEATLEPEGAESQLTWTSSNKSVATVSADGVVRPKKAGTTKIKVETANGKSASVTLIVYLAKPTKIKITNGADERTVKVGKKLKIKTKLTPSYAQTTLTWSSSNKAVATVKNGVVTGKKAGKAKITVKTANGKKATVTITVKKKSASGASYRALLVGNINFEGGSLDSCGYDVDNMAEMLAAVKGPEGGKFSVTKRKDIDRAQLFSAIKKAFSGADSDDVSLFYYSGHGDDTDYLGEYPDHPEYAEYCGAIPMIPASSDNWVLLSELADALKAVPGKVIIIIDTCGSGAGVYTVGNGRAAMNKAAARFDQAVVDAFAAVDDGVIVTEDGRVFERDGVLPNIGEYRVENKFYVLTAAAYAESSWCTNEYGLFTNWLIEGVGLSGRMPADADRNGVATLKELYKYISDVGDDYRIEYLDEDDNVCVAYQHVQVYPKKSGFEMFRR